jgi:hypothetical protein
MKGLNRMREKNTFTASEGAIVKFSMVCEDLQLSSPKSEHYLRGNKGRKTEHRPSSQTSQPTQSSSPQTHTTNQASPLGTEQALNIAYPKEEKRTTTCLISDPGYHSQNALASNKQKQSQTYQNTCRTTRAL